MKTRFLHCADIHLGYNQYNSPERGNDFASAFFAVIDTAIAEQVDFVILAGDLFHKRCHRRADPQSSRGRVWKNCKKPASLASPLRAIMSAPTTMSTSAGWTSCLSVTVDLADPRIRGRQAPTSTLRRTGSFHDPVPGVRVHGLPISAPAPMLPSPIMRTHWPSSTTGILNIPYLWPMPASKAYLPTKRAV